MSENLNLNSKIVVEFDDPELNNYVAKIREAQENTEEFDDSLDRLSKKLTDAQAAWRKASEGASEYASQNEAALAQFAEMESGVQSLTERLKELAAVHVAGGGLDPEGVAASSLTLERAKEIIAITEAQGVTAISAAREVVRAEELKQAALRETIETLKRHLNHQLELRASAQSDGAAWRNANSVESEQRERQQELTSFREGIQSRERQLRAYGDFRSQQTREHLTREEQARREELASFRAMIEERSRLQRQAQEENAMAAREYQLAFTDPRSFMGQENSRDASTGLRASETSWAIEETKRLSEEAENAATVALPRLRYALYDVSTTAGIMSAAISAAGAGVLAMSASYESSFTNVERTTLASAETTAQLKDELLGLTREIPESWAFITEIASIGAQLDIAEENLESFTGTTTRFSTVTGMSAETSAMAFGSLGQLLGVTAAEYENMGSAIAYVGVTSVATDEEIVKMSQRLAASAANAGMTAQEVIALSGALASLRVAPERAQGVMEVYFKNLNNALADGGERLESFARYAEMSTDEVRAMVASNPAGYFRELAAGLGSLDSVSATLALDELGLSGIRAGEVFGRVSSNVEVFDQALTNANQAWTDGTHLAHAYGLVVDDLASKWQIFLNALAEVGAGVGDALAPAAKAVLDILTPILQNFATFARSDFGRVFMVIAGVFAGMVAIMAGAVGTGALFLATMAAMKTAILELNVAGNASIFTLKGMSAAIKEVGIAGHIGARGVNTFKIALASTGIGLVVVALGTLAAAFMNAGSASESAFDAMIGSTSGLADAVRADRQAYEEGAGGILIYAGATEDASRAIDDNADSVRNAATILGAEMPQAVDATTGALSDQTAVLGENTIAWAQNALMQSEEFQKLASNPGFADAWQKMGADFSEVLQIAAAEGQVGIQNYFIGLANTTGQSAEVYASGSDQIFQTVIRMILGWGAGIAQAFNNVMELWASGASMMAKITNTPMVAAMGWGEASGAFDPLKDEFRGVSLIAEGMANQIRTLGSAMDGLTPSLNEGGASARDFGNDVGGAGDKAEEAAEKVRTLTDYAKDLAGVWGRAFEIRFSGEQTMDSITSQWLKMREAMSNAADAIAKYRAEMATLTADRSTMEYWLMVAENYGDQIRANELRAKIGETDQKLADTQKKLSVEQEKMNKSLDGNSETAIQNRKDILSLVSGYQSHLEALAASGASEEQLRAVTAQLRTEFIQQATQLGYNQTEIKKYAAAFDDVTVAINKVPRDITVKADTNPAIQAFNEYEAAATKAMDKVREAASKPVNFSGLNNPTNAKEMRRMALEAEMAVHAKNATWLASLGGAANMQGARLSAMEAARLRVLLASNSYRKGGPTGAGLDWEIDGLVHKNEFVFSAPAVRNIGTSNLAYMHEAAKSGRTMAPTMTSMARVIEAELSPTDRQLLRDIADRVGLSLNGDALQGFMGAGAINTGRRGRA